MAFATMDRLAVSPNPLRLATLLGVTALTASCEPNVLIGAKLLRDDEGVGGQVGASGSPSVGGTVSGSAGSGAETTGGDMTDGGDAGAPGAGLGGGGAGGAPSTPEWCATASWLNEQRLFESTTDTDNVLPAGSYVVKYVSGAQIHDVNIGYEVTAHYTGKNMIEAGHHIYSGESPEKGSTSSWLSATGLVPGGTIADVEEKNKGHTWALEHPQAGELFVILYDDVYEDNSGPGTRYCIAPAP
jgi:hypothetical protein